MTKIRVALGASLLLTLGLAIVVVVTSRREPTAAEVAATERGADQLALEHAADGPAPRDVDGQRLADCLESSGFVVHHIDATTMTVRDNGFAVHRVEVRDPQSVPAGEWNVSLQASTGRVSAERGHRFGVCLRTASS